MMIFTFRTLFWFRSGLLSYDYWLSPFSKRSSENRGKLPVSLLCWPSSNSRTSR